jgi:hypothetical protein
MPGTVHQGLWHIQQTILDKLAFQSGSTLYNMCLAGNGVLAQLLYRIALLLMILMYVGILTLELKKASSQTTGHGIKTNSPFLCLHLQVVALGTAQVI